MLNLKLHFILDMEENQAQFSPHFGIAYLSAYIKKQFPTVQISISYLSDKDIDGDIQRLSPHIIGVTSTSRRFTKMRRLAEGLKEKFSLPIIWGGVHISIAPHELPSWVELGVIGEGEETLKELLLNFSDGRFHNLASIRGIAYHEDSRLVVNERRPYVKSLDDLPFPDLELLRYRYLNQRGVLISSRGCPFKCRFCASSVFWDRTRLHSAEYVLAYIKKLVGQYGVREILIYDDFFTINKERVGQIADLIDQDSELANLQFECLSRVDGFDKALADNLRKMGIYKVSFGFESGSQKILDYLKNCKLKLEQSRKATEFAKEAGLQCVGSFVIGSPYETAEQVEQTFDFIEELDLDAVQVTVATPFPGTAIWEDGKKSGAVVDDSWRDEYYAMFAFAELELENTSVREFLISKRLLTQIEKEKFIGLVEKAGRLQARINQRGSERHLVRKKYFPVCIELIKTLREGGKTREALAVAALMTTLLPGQPELLVALGEMHFELGQLQEALKIFLSVVEKWPRNSIAHNNVGVAFQAVHHPNAALHHFKLALSLDPTDKVTVSNCSDLLASLGKTHQAQQLLSLYNRNHPQEDYSDQIVLNPERSITPGADSRL